MNLLKDALVLTIEKCLQDFNVKYTCVHTCKYVYVHKCTIMCSYMYNNLFKVPINRDHWPDLMKSRRFWNRSFRMVRNSDISGRPRDLNQFCHNHRHFKSNTCVDIPQVIRHKSLVSRCANKNGIQQWPPAEFDRVWIAHLEVYTKKASLSLRDLFGWWRKYDLDFNLLTLYDLRRSFESENYCLA